MNYGKFTLREEEVTEYSNKYSKPSFEVLKPGDWSQWSPRMKVELKCKGQMKWWDEEQQKESQPTYLKWEKDIFVNTLGKDAVRDDGEGASVKFTPPSKKNEAKWKDFTEKQERAREMLKRLKDTQKPWRMLLMEDFLQGNITEREFAKEMDKEGDAVATILVHVHHTLRDQATEHTTVPSLMKFLQDRTDHVSAHAQGFYSQALWSPENKMENLLQSAEAILRFERIVKGLEANGISMQDNTLKVAFLAWWPEAQHVAADKLREDPQADLEQTKQRLRELALENSLVQVLPQANQLEVLSEINATMAGDAKVQVDEVRKAVGWAKHWMLHEFGSHRQCHRNDCWFTKNCKSRPQDVQDFLNRHFPRHEKLARFKRGDEVSLTERQVQSWQTLLPQQQQHLQQQTQQQQKQKDGKPLGLFTTKLRIAE